MQNDGQKTIKELGYINRTRQQPDKHPHAELKKRIRAHTIMVLS